MQTHVEERDGGYDVAGMSLSLDSVVHTFHDGKSPEGFSALFRWPVPL